MKNAIITLLKLRNIMGKTHINPLHGEFSLFCRLPSSFMCKNLVAPRVRATDWGPKANICTL